MQRRSYRSVALPASAILAAFAWCALTVNAAPRGTTTNSATTYYNERYGFSLNLPADVSKPGNAGNPDLGGLWTSPDGQARLIAVAIENTAGDSLSTYRSFVIEQSYKTAKFDYTPVRGNWFVLSGILDDRIFYERITFACNGQYIYGWQLQYPVAERKLYDRIVEDIHRNYRPGRGENGRCGRSPRGPT